ncbi:MAG: VWA domain-containing protein [Clostridia bacterium]|nr:VWA domain-containing protein [Clostridia bacterium]
MKNEGLTHVCRNNVTELVFILDRSGSMSGLESDTIGGFNGMIEKQKREDGEAYVTTVLFDDRSVTVHDRIELEKVPKMTERDYYVGGCTALLDAIGSTVAHIEDIHRYARPEDVPQNTVFVITTDGMENASREYDRKTIKKLIERQKEKGWEFLFIGANIDAVTVASDMGISADHAVEYCCDKTGTKVVFEDVCCAVGSVRKGKKLGSGWCKNIRADRKSRG